MLVLVIFTKTQRQRQWAFEAGATRPKGSFACFNGFEPANLQLNRNTNRERMPSSYLKIRFILSFVDSSTFAF